MNRRSIAVFLVFLMLSCSVCTGIVFANDEQDRNQSSQSIPSPEFELDLVVHTYDRLRTAQGDFFEFYGWISEMNFTAQLINIKTNEIIEPYIDYVHRGTIWNLTINETYSLTIKKEGYITQIYPRITDFLNHNIYLLHTVLLKNSAPLFLWILGKKINTKIFFFFADIKFHTQDFHPK